MRSKVARPSFFVAATGLTTLFTVDYWKGDDWLRTSPRQEQKMLPSYEATFSVPLSCESCTKEVSKSLSRLPGIETVSFSIPSKLVTTKGTEPPSNIISSIQSTGRAAVIRGSGKPNSAAVCILETPPPAAHSTRSQPSPVRGLARLIELGDRITLLDLTLTGMQEGRYRASIRTSGDISAGKESLGTVFQGSEGDKTGELGELLVDSRGKGSLVGESDWRVHEMIGRGILVERLDNAQESSIPSSKQWSDRLALGVIARSAGVWENEKSVCSCTGKTVWEEREAMVRNGML